MPFFVSFVIFVVQAFLFEPPARYARSRARRSRRKTQRHFFWPFGPTKTCLSSRSLRPWRFIFYFLNRPLATLAQEREGREGRRKGIFFGPSGQQKHVFLRVLRDLRGSSFSFLTARSLRSLKAAKIAKNVFFGPQGQQKHAVLSVLCVLGASIFIF